MSVFSYNLLGINFPEREVPRRAANYTNYLNWEASSLVGRTACECLCVTPPDSMLRPAEFNVQRVPNYINSASVFNSRVITGQRPATNSSCSFATPRILKKRFNCKFVAIHHPKSPRARYHTQCTLCRQQPSRSRDQIATLRMESTFRHSLPCSANIHTDS
jgi:hypothetical protein